MRNDWKIKIYSIKKEPYSIIYFYYITILFFSCIKHWCKLDLLKNWSIIKTNNIFKLYIYIIIKKHLKLKVYGNNLLNAESIEILFKRLWLPFTSKVKERKIEKRFYTMMCSEVILVGKYSRSEFSTSSSNYISWLTTPLLAIITSSVRHEDTVLQLPRRRLSILQRSSLLPYV